MTIFVFRASKNSTTHFHLLNTVALLGVVRLVVKQMHMYATCTVTCTLYVHELNMHVHVHVCK